MYLNGVLDLFYNIFGYSSILWPSGYILAFKRPNFQTNALYWVKGSLTLSRSGGRGGSGNPSLNRSPADFEWAEIQSSPLVTFQVEASSSPWWSHFWNFFYEISRNWPAKTTGRPRFRGKNEKNEIFSHFSQSNHIFLLWIWILHNLSFHLRYIMCF